jgi:site-specific recombinase XerD
MASGTKRPNGCQWVFFRHNGKRDTLRLGDQITTAQRKDVERRLQRLIDTVKAGLPVDVDLRQWLAGLADKPHAVLAKHGLAAPRQNYTVAGIFAWHRKLLQEEQTAEATLKLFDRVEDNCVSYWGADRRIGDLAPTDCDKLRAWMLAAGNETTGEALARSTTSRRMAMVRQVLHAAKQRGFIASNPCEHIKRRGERNAERDAYVPWDLVKRLIQHEKRAEFRLLLAMVRICGLRCPSETAILPWAAFDFQLGLFQVRAPKTRNHKPLRDVPIFAELAPYIADLRTATLPGEFVFPNLNIASSSLTDRLESLCRKAKVPLWDKPWVNLRASAERDMLQVMPIDKVTAFLGHSPMTALAHYNRVAKDLRASASSALHAPDYAYGVKRNVKRSYARAT